MPATRREFLKNIYRGLLLKDFRKNVNYRTNRILILNALIALTRSTAETISPIILSEITQAISTKDIFSDTPKSFQIIDIFNEIIRSFSTKDVLSETSRSFSININKFSLPLFGHRYLFSVSDLLVLWLISLVSVKFLMIINELLISKIQMEASREMVAGEQKFLENLHKIQYEDFEIHLNQNSPSSLSRLLIRHTEDISRLLKIVFNDFLPLIFTTTLTMYHLSNDKNITHYNIVTLLVFIFSSAALSYILADIQRNKGSLTQEKASVFTEKFIEDLEQENTARLYGRADHHLLQEREIFNDFLNFIVTHDVLIAVLKLLVSIVLLLECYYALPYFDLDGNDRSMIDEVVMLANYFYLFYGMTQNFGNAMLTANDTIVNIDKILTVNNNRNLEQSISTIQIGPVTRNRPIIEFRNVSYIKNNLTIIDNVSFEIFNETSCALIGPSGAGKTTIIQLLCGLYTPTIGTILFDGADIKRLSAAELRSRLTHISSSTQLFRKVTRAESRLPYNVLYGEVTVSNHLLNNIAKEDALTEDGKEAFRNIYHRRCEQTIIHDLPPNLNKPSDGERQRVVLARGFRPTPLIILDEPTSQVDTITESRIIENFNEHVRTSRMNAQEGYIRALLVTGHRLSTVRQCDRILYIEHGRVMEHGTHEQLLQQAGRYANVFQMQQGPNPPSFQFRHR